MFQTRLFRITAIRTLIKPSRNAITRTKQAKLKNFPDVSTTTTQTKQQTTRVNKGKLLVVVTLAVVTSVTSLVYQRDPPSEFIES